jgi:hypothetical protein
VAEYTKIEERYWTGDTGRELRRLGRDAQLVGLFLLTGPGRHPIGIYHLPLPVLCHYTGLTPEGALKVLQSLSEAGFAHYDAAAEEVWVPEMAGRQYGEPLSADDNRVKAIVRRWQELRKSKFYQDFHKRYAKSFHLSKPSPSEAPSEPLRSQQQQHQQQHQQEETPSESLSPGPAPTPAPAEFLDQWNAVKGVRVAKAMTKARLTAFRARVRDAAWRADYRTALARIPTSAFLRGENPRRWRPDIDWFLRPDTVTKILEGKYHDGQPARTGGDYTQAEIDASLGPPRYPTKEELASWGCGPNGDGTEGGAPC